MVPAKPWQVDAVVRLALSVIICAYAGSLVFSLLHFAGDPSKVASRLFFPVAALGLVCMACALVLLSRPLNPETLFSRMVMIMAFGYGGLLLSFWGQHLSGMPATDLSLPRMTITTLSFQGAGLLLVGQSLREQGMTWTEAFGLGERRRRALALGLVAAVVFVPLGWQLQKLSALLMPHLPFLHLEPKEQTAVQALRDSLSLGAQLTMGATAVFLAPVAEEVLFRGILYSILKQLGRPKMALWVASLLFAVVHVNMATFIPLTLLAVVLTLLYEYSGNLLAPIAAHVLFNAVNFGMLLVQQHYKGA